MSPEVIFLGFFIVSETNGEQSTQEAAFGKMLSRYFSVPAHRSSFSLSPFGREDQLEKSPKRLKLCVVVCFIR